MSTSKRIEDLINVFQFDKILSSNPSTKSISLLGSIDSKPAIVSLEKTHFNVSSFEQETEEQNDKKDVLLKLIDKIKSINSNDIYYWSLATISQDLNDNPQLKVNVVWPATSAHIKKYSSQAFHMITETPEMYNEIVKPFIETQLGSRIKWVHNILFNGVESDKVLYKNESEHGGFVLLPDMKWDSVTMDSLYLVAILYRSDIHSIRDLTKKDQPWLQNIYDNLKDIVPNLYKGKIASDELKIFIHYQPSYYHFHIHIVHVNNNGLGNGISIGKAISLEQVIQWLDFVPDLSKINITYLIGEFHELWGLGIGQKLLEDGKKIIKD